MLNVAKKSCNFNSSQFQKQLLNTKYVPGNVPEARDSKMKTRALFKIWFIHTPEEPQWYIRKYLKPHYYYGLSLWVFNST